MSHVPDAVPRYEQRTSAGNKNPYSVLGQTYALMADERGYKERGRASWYGFKFNGELTSNGESYDMFAMTGAHKTLPIPSYVRVTNRDNGKSVIVRINDRGPFHEDRIIDLSYAAAQRLGITRLGTGEVEVEIVVPEDDPRPPLLPRKQDQTWAKVETGKDSKPKGGEILSKPGEGVQTAIAKTASVTYLQVAAFSLEQTAKVFASTLSAKLNQKVLIVRASLPQPLYRVRLGPFKDAAAVLAAREHLQKVDISQAQLVYQ
jgi:rare lipoprotein A